jgi:hypothetical protein
MTFSDLLSYIGFLTEAKGTTKEAAQRDIDMLAL